MTGQGGTSIVQTIRDVGSSLLAYLKPEASPFAVLDILIVAVVLYYTYLLIRETRAIRILYGLAVLGVIYGIAEWLQLLALLFLLRSIFAVILVAIPVVFQPELRAALERLGRTRFVGVGPTSSPTTASVTATLANAATLLAAKKIGALIVIERHDRLRDLSTTGVAIHAYVSTELLLSIFTPRTPLHDGAVLMHGSRIETAGVLLPVASGSFVPALGTRHRAAIGVTQETDAVVLVVSEETGRISIARDGKLTRNVRPATLESVLAQALVAGEPKPLTHLVRGNSAR